MCIANLSQLFTSTKCQLLTTIMCRFRSTDSYKKIGYHFGVSKRTATRVKWRVQGYMLFKVGAVMFDGKMGVQVENG